MGAQFDVIELRPRCLRSTPDEPRAAIEIVSIALYHADSRAQTGRRLDAFAAACHRAALAPAEDFATRVRAWGKEVLTYFDKPTTNATPKAYQSPSR